MVAIDCTFVKEIDSFVVKIKTVDPDPILLSEARIHRGELDILYTSEIVDVEQMLEIHSHILEGLFAPKNFTLLLTDEDLLEQEYAHALDNGILSRAQEVEIVSRFAVNSENFHLS